MLKLFKICREVQFHFYYGSSSITFSNQFSISSFTSIHTCIAIVTDASMHTYIRTHVRDTSTLYHTYIHSIHIYILMYVATDIREYTLTLLEDAYIYIHTYVATDLREYIHTCTSTTHTYILSYKIPIHLSRHTCIHTIHTQL